MTSTRDPTFMQALEETLQRREPIESPFAATPQPRAQPMAPGSFPTPGADAVLNPKLMEAMAREREAYVKRISNTPGAAAYEFHYDVFVVHRPPGACFECRVLTEQVFNQRREAIAGGIDPNTVAPGFDFHTCVHNRRAEYVALMNRVASKEVVVGSHREETLQAGIVQVCVSWGEPKRVSAKQKNTEPPKTPTL